VKQNLRGFVSSTQCWTIYQIVASINQRVLRSIRCMLIFVSCHLDNGDIHKLQIFLFYAYCMNYCSKGRMSKRVLFQRGRSPDRIYKTWDP